MDTIRARNREVRAFLLFGLSSPGITVIVFTRPVALCHIATGPRLTMRLIISIESCPKGYRVVWDEDGEVFHFGKTFTNLSAAKKFHDRLCTQRQRNRVNTDKIRTSDKWQAS